MHVLGGRVRQRRRQMGLSQSEVTETNTASLISKVENGRTLPSLANLSDLAMGLETTTCELIGEHLILEAAKLTVLYPTKCNEYLALLPPTTITSYLRALTASVHTKTPVPNPPPDPELHYLAVQVCMFLNQNNEALRIANQGLSISNRLWRIRLLIQLYYLLGLLNKEKDQIHVKSELRKAQKEISTSSIWLLSDAESLTTAEIDHFKLATLFQQINDIGIHF